MRYLPDPPRNFSYNPVLVSLAGILRCQRGADGFETRMPAQALRTMTLLAWRSPFQGVGVGIETPMVFQIFCGMASVMTRLSSE